MGEYDALQDGFSALLLLKKRPSFDNSTFTHNATSKHCWIRAFPITIDALFSRMQSRKHLHKTVLPYVYATFCFSMATKRTPTLYANRSEKRKNMHITLSCLSLANHFSFISHFQTCYHSIEGTYAPKKFPHFIRECEWALPPPNWETPFHPPLVAAASAIFSLNAIGRVVVVVVIRRMSRPRVPSAEKEGCSLF